MKIEEVLAEGYGKLEKRGSDNPHLEAEILLSHILKKPREYLFAHPEAELNQLQITNYKLRINQRLHGEPIAYITGEKEFYGLKFFVDKNVLVPRPETELMVDAARQLAISNPPAGEAGYELTMIDIGTGSGCIIITLAKKLKDLRFKIYDLRFFGTDISSKALTTAKKNAKLNGVGKNIIFSRGNLLDPILKSKILNLKSRIVILANLPYLTPTQIKNSPSIKFEPKLALSAGPDGLKYYRRLFKQIKSACLKNFVLLCEIDPSQKRSISALAKKILPPHQIEIKKDLRGHSRLAIITGKQ